ncbi:MAG TPA: HAD-IC family P-type ATPase, partial [Candidatus Methylomirabilis sp.]|nr:HAD-IC family P-type ATPase [Candidatus Methylomirabilis sp.]
MAVVMGTPSPGAAPPAARSSRRIRRRTLFTADLLRAAARQAFVMLRPDIQWKNPVMFVVEIGAALTILFIVDAAWGASTGRVAITYSIGLAFWLLLTVLFANFATAVAEERGKAQAESLRRTRRDTPAFRITGSGPAGTELVEVSSTRLGPGDLVVVLAGQIVPGDGEIVEGIATVDESAVTGESAPVIREAGGDRSGVTGGTLVLSDRIVVRITARPGESFLDQMIALVEGAVRQRTPNEVALTLVLTAFTLIFLIVVIPLWAMAWNAEQYMKGYLGLSEPIKSLGTDVPTLVALLVCLIPTTIGGLLAAIGIAGMDRALAANIIAKSGKAVEVAGDVDTLLLDKTGTITIGNRRATEFIPIGSRASEEVGRLAALASMGDETPEGKSIVALARSRMLTEALPPGAHVVPFTAQSRMSGIDLADGGSIRKGSVEAIVQHVERQGGSVPADLMPTVTEVAARGATP